MHGCGVNTPNAADVAAITCGFVGAMHIPNGAMFIIGTWSMIVAAGWPPIVTKLVGMTVRVDGAAPNEHVNAAPLLTSGGMADPFLQCPGSGRQFLPPHPIADPLTPD
jgi:hypothetical protein